MIETIYKTQTPEKGRSECYLLVLTSRVASGGKVYAFMQEHGLWSEDLERFIYSVNVISTEEELNYQAAQAMYESAKRRLAGKGFIHSFTFGNQRKEPSAGRFSPSETAIAS